MIAENEHDCLTTIRSPIVPFDRSSTVHRAHGKHLCTMLANRLLIALFGALVSWTVACASAGNSQKSGSNDATITHEEIENAHQPTLFDVVRALRPTWLRTTPTGLRTDADAGIAVYLDSQRAGSIDVLRQLPSTSASALRFYSASEAQSRFGLGNLHGVIQIVSPRGSP